MTEESFERAFDRLEEILQQMNEGKISLDTSLKLFEEADTLITRCQEKLTKAQQKIEILIKNRDDLVLENDRPKTKEFKSEHQNFLED
jgi:exodeoxyribonuclease VII small subunit